MYHVFWLSRHGCIAAHAARPHQREAAVKVDNSVGQHQDNVAAASPTAHHASVTAVVFAAVCCLLQTREHIILLFLYGSFHGAALPYLDGIHDKSMGLP